MPIPRDFPANIPSPPPGIDDLARYEPHVMFVEDNSVGLSSIVKVALTRAWISAVGNRNVNMTLVLFMSQK